MALMCTPSNCIINYKNAFIILLIIIIIIIIILKFVFYVARALRASRQTNTSLEGKDEFKSSKN